VGVRFSPRCQQHHAAQNDAGPKQSPFQVAFAQHDAAGNDGEYNAHLPRRRYISYGCERHRIEHQNISQRANRSDNQDGRAVLALLRCDAVPARPGYRDQHHTPA
jgi:hypothetical protein